MTENKGVFWENEVVNANWGVDRMQKCLMEFDWAGGHETSREG